MPESQDCPRPNPAGHTVWPVSTTWRSTADTVARAARPNSTAGPKARPIRSLRPRNPRDPLLSTLKWRGGPEGWVEVKTRGTVVRVPGHTCVAELVLLLNSQGYR